MPRQSFLPFYPWVAFVPSGNFPDMLRIVAYTSPWQNTTRVEVSHANQDSELILYWVYLIIPRTYAAHFTAQCSSLHDIPITRALFRPQFWHYDGTAYHWHYFFWQTYSLISSTKTGISIATKISYLVGAWIVRFLSRYPQVDFIDISVGPRTLPFTTMNIVSNVSRPQAMRYRPLLSLFITIHCIYWTEIATLIGWCS